MGAAASATPKSDAFVEELLDKHAVVVFSKTYCPYCEKAKEALSHYDIQDIVVVELDDRSDGGAVQASVKNLTGRGTVPSVFIGGSCIGGGDETAAMHRSGKLEGALQAANALRRTIS